MWHVLRHNMHHALSSSVAESCSSLSLLVLFDNAWSPSGTLGSRTLRSPLYLEMGRRERRGL